MNLKTRVFLLLLLISLGPLILAVAINLPLVLERVELFHRAAFLQNLRADFRDLDQHIASREEMIRLLTKLPEPGVMVGKQGDQTQAAIDIARARYTQWINSILSDQRDAIDIVFLDEQAEPKFWVQRDEKTQDWSPTGRPPRLPPRAALLSLLEPKAPRIVPSPLHVERGALDPRRELTLQLASVLHTRQGKRVGIVVLTLDIAGLARRDPNTRWVLGDGDYLQLSGMAARKTNAFTEFQGLREQFAGEKVALWEHRGTQWIWVPMFRTDAGQRLWVGRQVDDTQMREFRGTLVQRVLSIVFGLVLIFGLLVRWFARSAERMGRELTDGIRKIVTDAEPVSFSWQQPRELRRLADDLEQLSRKHAENSKRVLSHTRELEASNRYKSEFLANVSHELRTPLNSILLLSKMIREDESVNPERREQADVINKAGSDLRQLIDTILDLSRIEAGRDELRVVETDLHELARSMLDLMRPQFEAKGLTLDWQPEPEAPRIVQTDPNKLKQVLKNFLGNAVKFTQRGGAVLRLHLADAPHAYAFSVEDTGIGISAEHQAAVFEAFHQAEGATNRRFGGTGLGLTISRKIAHLLGGEIRLRSDPAQGSTFTLVLPTDPHSTESPKHSKPAHLAPTEAEVCEPGDGRLSLLSGQRVLLLSGSVKDLLMLTPLLERCGAKITAAGDMEEASEALLEDDGCDLLVLSDDLPECDTHATMQGIRELTSDPILPVLLIVDDLEASVCMDAQVTGCVTRPLNEKDFAAALKHGPEAGE